MLGAYIGDIVGSVYEWHNIHTKDFPLFSKNSRFTDDSVMTCAVANVLAKYKENGLPYDELSAAFAGEMRKLGNRYPDRGYGSKFKAWLLNPDAGPYNSLGNGSAMRVSATGWYGETIAETEDLAKISAAVSHNHPSGIKGAQAIAVAVFMARKKYTKAEINGYIEEKFYKLDFTIDGIRPTYKGLITCDGSVPEALEVFLEGKDFEDTIRLAISLGGDSDTIGAMAGAIADAYYGVPENIVQQVMPYLSPEMVGSIERLKNRNNV